MITNGCRHNPCSTIFFSLTKSSHVLSNDTVLSYDGPSHVNSKQYALLGSNSSITSEEVVPSEALVESVVELSCAIKIGTPIRKNILSILRMRVLKMGGANGTCYRDAIINQKFKIAKFMFLFKALRFEWL